MRWGEKILKRYCFNGVQEKANVKGFFSNEDVNYLPWTRAKIRNRGILLISDKNIKFSVQTTCHCCDFVMQLKGYEWVKLGEYQHQAKFDIYHIYSVREDCNVQVFATYGQLASGLTLIITQSDRLMSLFMWVKKLFFFPLSMTPDTECQILNWT